MKIHLALLAACLAPALIGTNLPASAQDLPRYATPYDCASWTRERQIKAGIGPESWVLGFVTSQAMEELYHNKRDSLSQHDFRALFSWLDNYCQSKPLDNLLNATLALVLELQQRALNQPTPPPR